MRRKWLWGEFAPLITDAIGFFGCAPGYIKGSVHGAKTGGLTPLGRDAIRMARDVLQSIAALAVHR
jgi:hypothetical protein